MPAQVVFRGCFSFFVLLLLLVFLVVISLIVLLIIVLILIFVGLDVLLFSMVIVSLMVVVVLLDHINATNPSVPRKFPAGSDASECPDPRFVISGGATTAPIQLSAVVSTCFAQLSGTGSSANLRGTEGVSALRGCEGNSPAREGS
jgi:hypothetical protein